MKELRERVRNILETGVGLEELAQKTPERVQIQPKKQIRLKTRNIDATVANSQVFAA